MENKEVLEEEIDEELEEESTGPKKTNYSYTQKKIAKKLGEIFKDEKSSQTFEQIIGGKNNYLKYRRVENAAYDPEWIEQIEECLFDLGTIIKAPKMTTQTVTDVVPVELARKTNAESINHLATHSQYVKEMDDDGNVIPNKILNIGADDFYQTYENRFIATLIRKLVLFVEKRWTYILENTQVKESQVLLYKVKTMVDGREVEIETKVKVASKMDYESNEINKNKEFARRVEELRRYLLYYYNSDFMKKFKTEKNVRNPILMTNIIRKNPLYNHAYRLYKFIERYQSLGVNVHITNNFFDLIDDDYEIINEAIATNFLALKPTETNPVKKSGSKIFKPTVLTTIDDDEFTYGPWYKGPFEMVRVDLGYLDHLENLEEDLPDHPSKKEREFFKDELEFRKMVRRRKTRLAKIIAEKKREAPKIEKRFQQIIEQRKLDEIEEQKRFENNNLAAQLAEIERARQMLVGEAPKKAKKSKKAQKDEQPNEVKEENN